jgi:hypothetical protein
LPVKVRKSQQAERDEVSKFPGLSQGEGSVVVSAGLGGEVVLYGKSNNHPKRTA